MSFLRLPFTALAKHALVDTLTHATYWVPALVLLSPTLLLQLAAPTYLRLGSRECDSQIWHADRDGDRRRRHRRLRLQGSPAHFLSLLGCAA